MATPTGAQVETLDMLIKDAPDKVVGYMEVIDSKATGRMWIELTDDGLMMAAVFDQNGTIVGDWIV